MMGTKKIFSFILVLGFILAQVSLAYEAVFQQSAEELYEAALFKKDVDGDLEGAIELFKKILDQFPDSRKVAAKAQLQIGLCYEKLGLKEAQKAFQKVIDSYPEQADVVKKAREKLAILLSTQAVLGKKDREFTMRKVLAGPGFDILGEVSPDGRYICFTDWDSGDIAIRDLVAEKNRRLSDKGSWMKSSDFALFSVWSSDGKKVACNWYNSKDNIFDLRIYGLEDSEAHILYNKSEYTHPLGWSSDGTQILTYFTGDDETIFLGLLSTKDGSMQTIKKLGEFYPSNAFFSPNADYIVYDIPVKKDTLNRDIFIITKDGSQEVAFVKNSADDALLGWSPDGKYILFLSDRTGELDMWATQVENGLSYGEPVLIRKDIGQIWSMGFTETGAMYYGFDPSMIDVYTASVNIEKGILLSPVEKASSSFVGSNTSPAWSPDGKYLAYVSKRQPGPERIGSKVLCIKNLKSGKVKVFTPELRNFGRIMYWGTDGSSVIVTGSGNEGPPGLFTINTSTGDTSSLFRKENGMPVPGFVLAPDGKTIYHRKNAGQKSIIFEYDLTTKQQKEIHSESSIYNLIISPDGKSLAYCSLEKSLKEIVMKILPTKGGEPREIMRIKQPETVHFQSPAWSSDGRYIIFGKGQSAMQDQEIDLCRVSVDGGTPQKLDISMDRLTHIRVHPDGKQIAFFAGQVKVEIWMMENFLPFIKK